MGHISNALNENLINKYKITTFIETGTFDGGGLRWVYSNSKFKNYYSIEINEKYFNNTKPNFPEPNIHLYLGDTISSLPKILDEIPQNEVILFWLDAHLPEFTDKEFKAQNVNQRIPLKQELEIIKQKRINNHDVIICDDLRIYEDGPFPHGTWSGRFQFGDLGTKFIYETMGAIYNIEKVYQHEGYIHILPMEKK